MMEKRIDEIKHECERQEVEQCTTILQLNDLRSNIREADNEEVAIQ